MPYYSITYRPLNLCAIDVMERYFKEYKHTKCYYIGAETGTKDKDDTINHYQIACELGEKQVSNVRNRLVKYLQKEGYSEDWKIALVLNTVKDSDWSYILGYCQKEARIGRTTIQSQVLEQATVFYNQKKLFLTDNMKSKKWTKDQIVNIFVAHCRSNNIPVFSVPRWDDFIQDNEENITFSTYSKMRQETVMDWVNIMLKKKK